MAQRESVRTFGRCLRQATLDAAVERTRGGARFYLDTDVVLPMILGIEAMIDAEGRMHRASSESKENLVRSLVSAALFGRVHMLRPHALELSRQLDLVEESVNQTFKNRVESLLTRLGVQDTVRELREMIESTQHDREDERLNKFAKIFRDYSSDTFVAVEQAAGHWTQRLKRLYGTVLHFDEMGPEVADLWQADGRDLRFFCETMNEHRPGQHRQNTMDAAALVSLQQMIKTSDQRGSALIRFYTETPALHRAWRDNQRMRERLSHAGPKKLSATDAEVGGIFRTADYFLMRLRFPELVPGSKVSSPLDRLRDLLTSIEETDRMSDAELQHAVRRIEFDGQRLEQMIDEFEALSLMRALWKRVPRQLLESQHLDLVLKDFRKVFDFVVKNAGELGEKIDHIREGLGGQLSQVAQWGVDFKALRAAGERLRARIQRRRLKPIDDPLRDLGLVRWGLPMQHSDMMWVAEAMQTLASASDSELDVQCFNLANALASARQELADCMKVAALLWALEMYDQAARLIEDFQTRASKEAGGLQGMPKGLNLLRVAAFLRGGGGLHPQEKAVSEIRRDRGSLRGEQRGIYDLGLGYVLYFARRQENQGARTSLRNRGAVDRLAQECFALGQEAINLLSQAGNQLALVYAINHCAYIATMTNLDVDAYPYVKRLLDFKASPDLWHARFDDTIGVYYCHKADRYIAERDLTGAEKSVQFASDYLADAKENDTGGIEIEAHLSELEDVRDRLGRAQPRSRRRKSSSNGPRRSST